MGAEGRSRCDGAEDDAVSRRPNIGAQLQMNGASEVVGGITRCTRGGGGGMGAVLAVLAVVEVEGGSG